MMSSAQSITHASHRLLRGFRAGILVICTTVAFTVALVGSPTDAQAENLIKRPGAHNHYSLELEPQLAVLWAGGGRGYYRNHYDNYYYSTGVGPGVRFSIPFMHNGPISKLNNNIGINFGLNTFFHPGNRYGEHPIVWTVPVAFQWNFYFTDIISVLGEVGLTTNLLTGRNRAFFYLDPLFQGGGRFQFGKVGVIVRVGYPMATVGANFQF